MYPNFCLLEICFELEDIRFVLSYGNLGNICGDGGGCDGWGKGGEGEKGEGRRGR